MFDEEDQRKIDRLSEMTSAYVAGQRAPSAPDDLLDAIIAVLEVLGEDWSE